MIGRTKRSLYRDGASMRIGIPKVWADALGLRPGDCLDGFFDEVLVLVPRKSAQADRVLKAMRERH